MTPYLGGVAILLGTLTCVFAAVDPSMIAILLGGCAVAILGLLDDLQPLSPVVRLMVEVVVATGVVLNGVRAPLSGQWMDIPLTVLWIVLITNAFNLLDNMDGALAGIGAVSCGLLSATAFALGQPSPGLLLAALSAACLGFLLHNWRPARMFMGDAGSLFLGFTTSCSAVLLVSQQGGAAVPAGMLLPVFMGVVDTGVVLISRKLNGRSLLRGGTDHVSHRMRRLGLGTGTVVVTLAAVAGLGGVLGLAIVLGAVDATVAMIAAGGAALLLVALFQGVDVYETATAPGAPSQSTRKLS
ncbi:MraY family glycosyltransferase [Nonomuraea sp. NPDC050536]|uniref:MraY family glycosyltransferase n=1 Tax=Nonomuraea sp. NPDC050536 TaxID=3364366 RepID=UPI0037C5994A